jgi:hypothetical protein
MPTKISVFLSVLIVKLKHLHRLILQKDIFTPEFLRKAYAFFAKPDELVTEFPAEV